MIKKSNSHTPLQLNMLEACFSRLFGTEEIALRSEFSALAEWLEIEGGTILFKQGDPADGMYMVISGRLAAFQKDEQGKSIKLGEIIRGETAGEMALYTGGLRSADVMAIRSSVLVKISLEHFEKLLIEHPKLSLNITRLIIKRNLKGRSSQLHKPSIIYLDDMLEIKGPLNLSDLFPEVLRNSGTVKLLNKEKAIQETGLTLTEGYGDAYGPLIHWLNEHEIASDLLILIGQKDDLQWNQFCRMQADRIVYIADASKDVLETRQGLSNPYTGIAEEYLLLVHPSDTVLPRNTAEWLQLRPQLKGHYHVRSGNKSDYARFIRLISGNGIGLVLAGGGAKGFAHLGVYKALKEYGIQVDYIGGTSIGALVGAAMAFDAGYDVKYKELKKAALYHPTKDFNYFLMLSLIRGGRIKHVIKTAIKRFSSGLSPDIEDTWIPFFAVSSNYTKAEECIHTKGNLERILRASCAIPGVFPPVVIQGELHIDGGTFNNFPASTMRKMGVSHVIGVDFVMDKTYELNFEDVPDPKTMFRDKLRDRKKRKFRLPSLISIILNSTLLYSYARRRETMTDVDLHFNPSVSKFGFTNWKAFDRFVNEGYKHAKGVLEQIPEAELEKYR